MAEMHKEPAELLPGGRWEQKGCQSIENEIQIKMQTTGQRIGHIQMLAKQQAPGYAAEGCLCLDCPGMAEEISRAEHKRS